MNSFFNEIRMIVDQPGQDTASPYYDFQARALLERISEINRLHPDRPEVVRYAVFRIFVFLYNAFRSHRPKRKENARENVIDYVANLTDRIHSQMPSLRLKELFIGHAVATFRFLLPEAPPPG